jgi:hypothetical protein
LASVALLIVKSAHEGKGPARLTGRAGSRHLSVGQMASRVIHPFNARHACTTTAEVATPKPSRDDDKMQVFTSVAKQTKQQQASRAS